MSLEPHDDELRELFLRTQPTEVRVDVQQIVTHAKSEHVSNLSTTKPQARNLFMTIRAGILLAVVASLLFFFVGPLVSDKAIALADVQAEVERVRSVEYVEISYDAKQNVPEPGVILSGETAAEAIARLEQILPTASKDVAERIKFELDILRHAEKLRVLYVRRVRIKGKHLERVDQLFPSATSEGYVMPPHTVRNARNGLTVSFSPTEKKRTVLTKQVVLNLESGERSESEIPKISPAVDFFARFRSIPAKATEKLAEKTIKGQKVVGFRSVETHGDETWTRTHWVGIKSKLPVEVVTEVRSKGKLAQRWVHNRFEFDGELSDELFNTDTPDGYQSEDGMVMGLE